jgi:hypothetical protein
LRVSMETTITELGTVLAQLLRFLRNARGAGVPDPLGPIATASGFVAAMENTTPRLCWHWASVRDWPTTRLAVGPWYLVRAKALS